MTNPRAALRDVALCAAVCDSPVPLPRLVCCWCSPSHVMRDGPEPASHGACPVAVAQLHAEMDATEAACR